MWGPKKNDSLRDDPRRSDVRQTLLPAPISIITDSNLSDRDLWILHELRRTIKSDYYSLCDDVVLVHLFNEYGLSLSDRTLLYACLAYGVGKVYRTRFQFSETVYWDYVSRFQKSMMCAIQKQSISEYHLFAVYLILQSRLQHDLNFGLFHGQGFVTILRRLISANQNGNSVVQGTPRLTFLWHYSLSFLCRVEFHSYDSGQRKVVWELHDAADELRFPEILPDNRFTKMFPPLCWQENNSINDWQSLLCSLINDKAILRVCVERLVCVSVCEVETTSKVARSIGSVKQRLAAMRHLESVVNLLDSVCVTMGDKLTISRTGNAIRVFSLALTGAALGGANMNFSMRCSIIGRF